MPSQRKLHRNFIIDLGLLKKKKKNQPSSTFRAALNSTADLALTCLYKTILAHTTVHHDKSGILTKYSSLVYVELQ